MKRGSSLASKFWFGALVFGLAGYLSPAWAGKPEKDVASFVAAKRKQVEQTANRLGARVPAEVWKMFDAAAAGDWLATSNLFERVETQYRPVEQGRATNRLPPEVWYPVQEAGGFCELFTFTGAKYLRMFSDEVFKVVPAGSVYFGGTDPGRFVITALSVSDQEGKPFFTLTQNQLVATNYLDYLRQMHGKELKLPERAEVAEAFNDYATDATRRAQHDKDFPNEPKQVRPGEEMRTVDGRMQVTGVMAVMAINGLLAKDIFDSNPSREFWVEESYPIEWMYPHLTPVGPIFKLSRRPLDRLTDETVMADRQYWRQLTGRLIGSNIHDESTLSEVCALAKRLCQKTVPSGFKGDAAFLRDDAARKTFSKLRSASGGMYAWRANHSISSVEKRRMAGEAELADKQAFVLCPSSPEAMGRYSNFLLEQERFDDAQVFIRSALELNPSDPYVKQLAQYMKQLIQWKKQTQ